MINFSATSKMLMLMMLMMLKMLMMLMRKHEQIKCEFYIRCLSCNSSDHSKPLIYNY